MPFSFRRFRLSRSSGYTFERALTSVQSRFQANVNDIVEPRLFPRCCLQLCFRTNHLTFRGFAWKGLLDVSFSVFLSCRTIVSRKLQYDGRRLIGPLFCQALMEYFFASRFRESFHLSTRTSYQRASVPRIRKRLEKRRVTPQPVST